ncbi:MAG: hypothetical protein H6920_09810 [Sphingomonadaceae bacterium]|nr:hypothetical protein [Novosphingobium sp.]MCP5391900.1 hypothetical protein [Sphingomonadaceae bacterium]
MSQYRDLMAAPPQIATRAELDQRLSARAVPEPQRAPAPSLGERLEMLRATEQTNEERIADLTRVLDDAGRNLSHDYAQSSLKGRACVDFEQSR